MRKLIISFMFMLATLASANAMNSRDARRAALFLTDKMAYELNLTMEQYQSVFEINYDYFLSIDRDDAYGINWSRRNSDLSFILGGSKYNRFRASFYFYRPVYWINNNLTLRVYSRYADRGHYFYRSPRYCAVYNGEHSWRTNNGRSYYRGRGYSDDVYYHGNKHFDRDNSYRQRGPKMKEWKGNGHAYGHGKHGRY